jgi:hypothetical protein
LRTGIDLAFRLLGLISGETTSNLRESIVAQTASPGNRSAYDGEHTKQIVDINRLIEQWATSYSRQVDQR